MSGGPDLQEELAAATPAAPPGAATAAVAGPAPRARGRGEVLYFARRNRKLVAGLVVVAGFLVVAAVGPLLVRDHHLRPGRVRPVHPRAALDLPGRGAGRGAGGADRHADRLHRRLPGRGGGRGPEH